MQDERRSILSSDTVTPVFITVAINNTFFDKISVNSLLRMIDKNNLVLELSNI